MRQRRRFVMFHAQMNDSLDLLDTLGKVQIAGHRVRGIAAKHHQSRNLSRPQSRAKSLERICLRSR